MRCHSLEMCVNSTINFMLFFLWVRKLFNFLEFPASCKENTTSLDYVKTCYSKQGSDRKKRRNNDPDGIQKRFERYTKLPRDKKIAWYSFSRKVKLAKQDLNKENATKRQMMVWRSDENISLVYLIDAQAHLFDEIILWSYSYPFWYRHFIWAVGYKLHVFFEQTRKISLFLCFIL